MTTINHALAKKLGLKLGMDALIDGAPRKYLASLGPYLDGTSGGACFVQTFVTDKAQLALCAKRLTEDATALVWVTYPKKTSGVASDLSREVVRDVMSERGWIAVTIVSVDDVWSALRFRPKAAVKTTRER